MNNDRVRKAMKSAFERLSSMHPSELRGQIDEHLDGPIANALINSGMFEGRIQEARALAPSSDAAVVAEPGNVQVGYAPGNVIGSTYYIDLGTIKSSVGFTSVVTSFVSVPLSAIGLIEAEYNWIVFDSIVLPSRMYMIGEAPRREFGAHVKEELEWAKAA